MRKILFLLVILFWAGSGFAQYLEAGFSSLAGTNGQLPTWLWANQLGRYDKNSSSIQNFELAANYNTKPDKSGFSIEGHMLMNVLIADESDIRFTELFGAINWKTIQLKGGAFAEEEIYQGLSSTNGHLAYSRNARPHPRLRLGFNRFVTIVPKWFAIYGFWEEGLLNDQRYVKDTHLHQLAAYFRLGTPAFVQFSGGIDYYVMWWGTHPVYGELPGWENYFDYVFGKPGGANAISTEQENILGNTYGTYQAELKKEWDKFGVTIYLSHPFDDQSGMEWFNWRDNLYGLFIAIHKKQPVLNGVLIEYYYTKHQSGSSFMELQPDGTHSGRGRDNYFNNGIYQSGVTYKQMAMVSPLFAPLKFNEGISMGFENNRITGFHVGANGFINRQLQWKTMLSHTINFGRYRADGLSTYEPARKQLSSLFQVNWQLPKNPVVLGLSFAADHGPLYDEGQTTNRFGAMFSVNWHIVQ